MFRWRIYYGDDSTFSNLEGTIWEVPPRDVQVIIQTDRDHGWASQTGSDYYVWDNRGDGERWWGVDIFGLFDYLLEPGPRKVLFGRTVTSERFGEIFRRAKADPGFERKTAFRRQERRP
jgi:hypothetical protein